MALSWAKRNKTERLLLNLPALNLPDLHAYVKIPNIPEITETTLTYKSYPAKTEPFLIDPTSFWSGSSARLSFFGDGGRETEGDECRTRPSRTSIDRNTRPSYPVMDCLSKLVSSENPHHQCHDRWVFCPVGATNQLFSEAIFVALVRSQGRLLSLPVFPLS